NGEADMAIGLPDLGYNIYPLYTSFGGYIFGRDAAGSYTADDIGMDNEGMIAGLAWVQMLVDEGLVSENIDWDAAHVLFETGRTPFVLTGPWAITRFEEAGVPYAVGAFPAAEAGGEPGAPFMGIQGLVLNANSPNVLLAQTFATEMLATEDAMQALFDQEPTPSAWLSVFESASDPNTAGFNAAGVNAQPMPSIPAMGYVWDAWSNAGTLVVQGELSPAEALTSAVEQIRTQIESNQ
ncbi:MAG: extracellular solute-binding protein, partial [Chloroflexota bacterium]